MTQESGHDDLCVARSYNPRHDCYCDLIDRVVARERKRSAAGLLALHERIAELQEECDDTRRNVSEDIAQAIEEERAQFMRTTSTDEHHWLSRVFTECAAVARRFKVKENTEMSSRDPMCPASIARIEHRPDICRCEEYARVRADERGIPVAMILADARDALLTDLRRQVDKRRRTERQWITGDPDDYNSTLARGAVAALDGVLDMLESGVPS